MHFVQLPDDIIRTFCKYLGIKDIFRLEQTSKRFHKVKKYIVNAKVL